MCRGLSNFPQLCLQPQRVLYASFVYASLNEILNAGLTIWILHTASLSFCHWKGLKVFHQCIRYWKNGYSMSNKSSNEKLSYPAAIVFSRCSDADWSRQSGEGFLTCQHADPHLLRTEQEVQCTQGDLGRWNRNHHNDKKCSWKVLL